MLNPKSYKATYKCKPGCLEGRLCAPCKNFRKTFTVGKVVTWGSCMSAFPIIEVRSESVVVDTSTGRFRDKTEVWFGDTELQLTAAIVGKRYNIGEAAIPLTRRK